VVTSPPCTLAIAEVSPGARPKSLDAREIPEQAGGRLRQKKCKIGRKGATRFFGFRRPKSVVGSLLPSATMPRAAFFPHWRRFRMKHKSL